MSMDLPPKLWLPPKPAIIRPAPVQKANFLPGMFPFIPAQSAAAVLTTLSFKSSSTSTGVTLTAPSDIVAGNLLVFLDSIVSSSSITTVIPSDFTSIVETSGAFGKQITSYKIADGSEASASLTGMTGNFMVRKIMAVFEGDVSITSVTPSTPTSQYTSVNPSSQLIEASAGVAPLIAFGCYGGSLSIDPRTWTGGTPNSIANGIYLLYEIFNSSPGDRTIDMDDEGDSNMLQGFYLQCA